LRKRVRIMTDPFDARPLDPSRLDAAWRLYNHGSCSFNAALMAMEDAGVTLAEARSLLGAPQVPSQGYLAGAR